MTTLLRPRNITRADLEWWLELAPTLTWTFAKTYAETAPHSYVVDGKTPGLTRHDYVRAAAVIRTFGQPAKYYSMTNIYLTNADGSLKWWSMDKRVTDTNLINQATTDRVYGEQEAPSTFSSHHSVYDEIATDYDELRSPVDGDDKTALLDLLADLQERGVPPERPTVLDVGCGTGAVLDLGVTTPDRYTGVDPSQPMLNELLMKYNRSKLAGIIPARIEDVLGDLHGQKFDLVIAAFGSASYVEAEVLPQLRALASGATILVGFSPHYTPAFEDRVAAPYRDLRTPGDDAAVIPLGKFDAVVLPGSAALVRS